MADEMTVVEAVTVVFTLEELWLLNDFVRHDEERYDENSKPPKYPTVSTELNEDIALALVACVESNLKEYALALSYRDMLLIDYHVRRDAKNQGGAKGYEILLKTFRAREALANNLSVVVDPKEDKTYAEELKNAQSESEPKSDEDPDEKGSTGDGPNAGTPA
jgi:hypothetical protein